MHRLIDLIRLMKLMASASAVLVICSCVDSDVLPKNSPVEFSCNETRLSGRCFGSRSGEMLGLDSDAKIVFHKNGMVEVTEYGLGVEKHEGKYKFNQSNNIIKLELDDGMKWPVMILKYYLGRMELHRLDGQTSMFPDLKDAKVFDGFWPFAEIMGK